MLNKSSYYADGQLYVEGKPFYILGAEMQYFRLPKTSWEMHLKALVDCGMNTVSSYMPWIHHETSEGSFDFTGKNTPEHNLLEFIQLAGSLGLKVIARPGPFVNNEYRYGGLPHWLCEKHPEVMSHHANGKIAPGRPCPAEGESIYRDYVKKWYSQIVPLLSNHQIDRGGPIILFQPDNELSAAWSFGLLNSLYDPETINIRWPKYLEGIYQSIRQLNAHYGTHYKFFAEVLPPRTFPDTPSTRLLASDWLNFKRALIVDWGTAMATYAREYGITVPLVFNEPVAGFYNHGDHPYFSSEIKKRHPETITACHLYSDRIFDLEGLTNMILAVEITRSAQNIGPALSVEANINWNISRLNKSEINWSPLMRSGFGSGLNGNLVFLFAEHQSTFTDTIDAPYHWSPGAVSLTGERNYGFYALQQFNNFFNHWQDRLALTQKQSDMQIAYTAGMRYLDFMGTPELLPLPEEKIGKGRHSTPGGIAFDAEPALDRGTTGGGHDWTDGYEGVSRQTVKLEDGIWRKVKEMAILCSHLNVNFEFNNLLHPKIPCSTGLLAVPNTGALEKLAIDYIINHLDKGGDCLFSPAVPAFNEDHEADNRLLDKLGIKLKTSIRPAGGVTYDYGCRVVDFGNGEQMGIHSWILIYDFPANATILARYKGIPVAASIPIGKSHATVIGFDPSFTSKATANFWRSVLPMNPLVNCQGNNYCCTLRTSEDMTVLTAINAEGRYGKAKIKARNIPEFELELMPFEARMLLCNTKINDRRIIYTSSELSPLDSSLTRFRVNGALGTFGEIAFDKSTKVKLNEEIVQTKVKNGLFVLEYSHGRDMEISLL